MPAAGSLLTAVETKTRSPQTIGLDTARPAIGVFHSTFSPVAAFQFTARRRAVGDAGRGGPRNDGQFCADSAAHAANQTTADETLEVASISLLLLPRSR